eukprot:scaffold1395_cov152-Amphora_coffeaeformis.AAC.1
METMSRPVRRNRRVSLSCMPSDGDPASMGMGKTKEDLYEEYKAEKAARLKAHDEAEALFRQKTQAIELVETSGLAEQDEEITTRVSLETFERPKVSRRQRRASMGVSLQILDAPEEVKLELEEVEKVVMPISPVVTTNFLDSNGIFNPGAWDGSATTDHNIMFNAEALAGWKTVNFEDGPLGLQLEPTVGDKACRVTGFLDTLGCPSAARESGQIQFDDVIVKVNGKVPASYEETLEMIAAGGKRAICFRPGFSYELVDLSGSLSPGRNKTKKKVGRAGRRASMGAVPSSMGSGSRSPKDVFSVNLDQNDSHQANEYGYGDDTDDMGYGYGESAPKAESPKVRKKAVSNRGRRASCMGAMPGTMPALVPPSREDSYKAKKEALEKFRSGSDDEDMGYGNAAPAPKTKKSSRGRRMSCTAAMPGLVKAVEATKPKKSEEDMGYGYEDPTPAPPKEESKKKAPSKKGRRASMSAMPMPGLVEATELTKPHKEEKKSSKSKKESSFSDLGYTPASSSTVGLGYGPAEPEVKVEKKKSSSKKGRRASMGAIPSNLDADDLKSSSKGKMVLIRALEEADAKKAKQKKKKEEDSESHVVEKKKKKKDTNEEAHNSPKIEKKKKKKHIEEDAADDKHAKKEKSSKKKDSEAESKSKTKSSDDKEKKKELKEKK